MRWIFSENDEMMIGMLQRKLHWVGVTYGSTGIGRLNKPNAQHLRLRNFLQQKKGVFQWVKSF